MNAFLTEDKSICHFKVQVFDIGQDINALSVKIILTCFFFCLNLFLLT